MLSTVTQLTAREIALYNLCCTEYQASDRKAATATCLAALNGERPTLRERFEVQDYINSANGVKHLRDGMGEVMLATNDICNMSR